MSVVIAVNLIIGLMSLIFTLIGILAKEYCPIPLNFFFLLSVMVMLISYHSYFLPFYFIYIIIGYFVSIKWYKNYWTSGNKYKLLNVDSIESYVMVFDMIIYWPIYFIKKIKINFKTPFSEVRKDNV